MTYGNYSTSGASSSRNPNPSTSSSLAATGINPVRQKRQYNHQAVTEDGITYNRAVTPDNETPKDKAARDNTNQVAKSKAKKKAGGEMWQKRQKRQYNHQAVTEDGITYNRAVTPDNETPKDKAVRDNTNRVTKSKAKKKAGGEMRQKRQYNHQAVTEDGITYNRAVTPDNETPKDKAARDNTNQVAKSKAKKKAGGEMRQKRQYNHQAVTEDGITYNRAVTPDNETPKDKAARDNANQVAKSKAKKKAGGEMRHHPYGQAASRSRASGSQIGASSVGDASTSYQSGSFSASLPAASISDHPSFGVPSQSSNPFFTPQSPSFFGEQAAGTSSSAALSFAHQQPYIPDFTQPNPTMGIFGSEQQAYPPTYSDFTQPNPMHFLQLQQQTHHDPMSHLPHLSLAVRTSLEELQSTLNTNGIYFVNNETINHFGENTAFASMQPHDQNNRIQTYINTFNLMAGTEPFSSNLQNTCAIDESQRGPFDAIQVLHHYTFRTTDTSQTQPVTYE